MDLGLSEKVIFITGVSGGIGRALCQAFAAEGALLGLHGNRKFDELEKWVSEQDFHTRALCVRADITQPAEVDRAVKDTEERFGRVDVCVANAGIWPPEDLLLHRSHLERVRTTIDVNLMGAMWTARAFMASLDRKGPRADGDGGSLTFIGSTAGHFGEKGHAEYAVAKAGLYGLLRSLKNEVVELDPHARVNLIEPGWTATHMARPTLDEPGNIARAVRTMPLRQIGKAQDIANAALYLASPTMARHVTGQVLTVAGGMEGRTLWETGSIDEDAIRSRLREG